MGTDCQNPTNATNPPRRAKLAPDLRPDLWGPRGGLGAFPESPWAVFNLDPAAQKIAVAWMRLAVRAVPTLLRTATSYALKADLEAEVLGYIANAGFKGAMLLAGFEPQDPTRADWLFAIAPTAARRAITYDRLLRFGFPLRRLHIGRFSAVGGPDDEVRALLLADRDVGRHVEETR